MNFGDIFVGGETLSTFQTRGTAANPLVNSFPGQQFAVRFKVLTMVGDQAMEKPTVPRVSITGAASGLIAGADAFNTQPWIRQFSVVFSQVSKPFSFTVRVEMSGVVNGKPVKVDRSRTVFVSVAGEAVEVPLPPPPADQDASCQVEFDPPVKVINGQTIAVRKVGDPSNIRVRITGLASNSNVTVQNFRLDTGEVVNSGSIRADSQGNVLIRDSSPVPSVFRAGVHGTQMRFTEDGQSKVSECQGGRFLIEEESSVPPPLMPIPGKVVPVDPDRPPIIDTEGAPADVEETQMVDSTAGMLTPICTLTWGDPIESDSQGEFGVRRAGESSDVRITLDGLLPNTSYVLDNRHVSGFSSNIAVKTDAEGFFEVFSNTPVPLDWPAGQWQVLLSGPGIDGEKVCGRFRIDAGAVGECRAGTVLGPGGSCVLPDTPGGGGGGLDASLLIGLIGLIVLLFRE